MAAVRARRWVMGSYAEQVGERLRNIRLQKGLSLHDVEERSGKEFKASVLGAYERGERSISVPRLQRLAIFYGVPVDHLLPRLGAEPTDGAGEADGGAAPARDELRRPPARRLAQAPGVEVRWRSPPGRRPRWPSRPSAAGSTRPSPSRPSRPLARAASTSPTRARSPTWWWSTPAPLRRSRPPRRGA